MLKVKELVYLILDELKLTTDDTIINENHIVFLLNKYRVFLLKLRYSDVKRLIPESNYQTICLDLETYSSDDTDNCSSVYRRSIKELPNIMKIGNISITTNDQFSHHINYIPILRFSFVGGNPYLKNIIYSTLGNDNHLYLKSDNVFYKYLSKVLVTGIFEDFEEASNLSCNLNKDTECDILDRDFPIEAALIQPLISIIVKEIGESIYRKEDYNNNSSDDLAGNSIK